MAGYPKKIAFQVIHRLTVEEFDNIYSKIERKYGNHEVQRLSKRKDRERETGAGRHFKIDAKNRFLMLLVYCRLCITHTLAGFLFDLDQSNICSDIQKIESLVRGCAPIPQKMCRLTKRLRTPQEAERHFPGFIAFTDCTEQQIQSRPENRRREKMHYSGKRKRLTVKTQIMVSNQGLIIHKASHKKGRRHDYDIHKKSHPATPKQVASVFDLGYLGVGRDYPEQISSPPNKKKRNTGLPRGKRLQQKPF